MYLAGYIVTGFVVAGLLRVGRAARALGPLRADRARDPARGRRGRRAGAGDRRRLGRPRRHRRSSRSSSRRSRASATRRAARRCTSSAGTTATTCATASRSRGCSRSSRKHDPNATVAGPRRRAAGGPPAELAVNVDALRVPDDGRHRHRCWRCSACCSCYVRIRKRRLPESRWFYRAVLAAGPASVVALIAGWVTTEVGRQPWVVYQVMRTSEAVTGAAAASRSATPRWSCVYARARGRGRGGCCGAWRQPLAGRAGADAVPRSRASRVR